MLEATVHKVLELYSTNYMVHTKIAFTEVRICMTIYRILTGWNMAHSTVLVLLTSMPGSVL